jgi:hypothetical protein
MSNTRNASVSKAPNTITIRPQQPLYWLVLIGCLFVGVSAAGKVYGRGFWFFAASFAVVAAGFLSDRLVFDGERLRRRGLAAWLASRCGLKCEMAVGDIETVTSFQSKARGDAPGYRTTISGAGLKWTVNSHRRQYRALIQSLCGALSQHQLDPLSSELLAHWGEGQSRQTFGDTAQTAQKVLRWRALANRLALDGNFDVAAQYFRLAYEHDPNNARLVYEMARFLRRRLSANFQPKGEAARRSAERAETYLRLAAQLAAHERDAALLERIGETFFETRQGRQARRCFEQAVQFDAQRVRASLGLAAMALEQGQVAKAAHSYYAAARGAEEAGAVSLAELAARKADYYQRLMGDGEFLSAEASREGVLKQLKWGRRAAFAFFLVAWLLQLGSYQLTSAVHNFSREITATAAVMWVITTTATYIFSQRRG